MEVERLKHEIKKARDACAEVQRTFESNKMALSNAMDSNTSLKNKNNLLKEKLKEINETTTSSENENQALIASKRDLQDNLKQMMENSLEHNKLKADVLTLEEQLVQLRIQLAHTNEQNSQLIQESEFLNNSFVNTNNKVVEAESRLKDALEEITEFETKIEKSNKEKTFHQKNYDDRIAELQRNKQNKYTLLETLQKNRVLAADNNRLQREVDESVSSKERYQLQSEVNQDQVLNLQKNMAASLKDIADLDRQKAENIAKINELSETLKTLKAGLENATVDRNCKDLENHSLKKESSELKLNYNSLEILRDRATEQLFNALNVNTKYRNEITAAKNAADNGGVFSDLKMALLTNILVTRGVLGKLDKLPEDVLNTELEECDESGGFPAVD